MKNNSLKVIVSAASCHLLVVFKNIEYLGLTAGMQVRKISLLRDYLMRRHWEELVGPLYNTREMGCEAKVGGGVSALQRAREAEHHPSSVPWEGL